MALNMWKNIDNYIEIRTENCRVHDNYMHNQMENIGMNEQINREKINIMNTTNDFVIIRCRIFCLPVCHPKIQRLRYTEL
jgi:hypothetical protein